MAENPLEALRDDFTEEAPAERKGLLDTFREDGFIEGLGQTVGMLTPGSSTPAGAQSGFGGLWDEIVEWSPYGDAKDAYAAVNPTSGLDPLERGLAGLEWLPFVGGGVALTAGAAAAVRYNPRAIQARTNARLAASLKQELDAAISGGGGMRFEDFTADTVNDLNESDAVQRRQLVSAFLERYQRQANGAFGLAESNTFDELTAGLANDLGLPDTSEFDQSDASIEAYNRRVDIHNNLRAVGNVLVKELPGWYGSADPSVTADMDPDAVALTAAQFTAIRLKTLTESGALVALDGQSISLGEALSRPDLMLQVELQGQRLLSDPLGNLGPQGRVVQVRVGKDATDVSTWVGFHTEVSLNDERVINTETGDVNEEALTRRLGYIDYDTLVGEFSANILTAYRDAAPDVIKRGHDWYRGANRAASYLSSVSGYRTDTVAALFSALSPQTAWVPDNFVGAIHSVLQYTPGLESRSPEYREHFKQAVRESGHLEDLFVESSRELKKRFKTPEEMLDYWSDPSNARTSKGSRRGVKSLRGVDNQQTKHEAIQLLLESDLPPQVLLRMWKTHAFGHSIFDPEAFDPVVIDRFQDHLLVGTVAAGEPLGSRGTQKMWNSPFWDPETESYVNPFTRLEVTREMIEETRAKLEKAKWRKADIDRVISRLEDVPDPYASARYRAGAIAHQMVAEIEGLDASHMVQAPTWAWTRAIKQEWKKGRKNTDPEVRAQATRMGTFSDRVPLHAEGGTDVETGILGYVQRPSTNIYEGTLPGVESRAKSKHTPGQAILVSPDPASDGYFVFADLSVPGVRESLRHLYPSYRAEGQYTQMLPRRAMQVQDHKAAADRFVSDDDGFVDVEVTSRPYDGRAPHGLRPGDRFVFVVDDPGVVVSRLMEIDPSLDVKVGQVEHRAEGPAQQRYGQEDLAQIEDLADPARSPIVRGKWAAISAPAGRESELRTRLLGAGFRPVPAVGRWGESATGSATFKNPRLEADRVSAELESLETKYMAERGLPAVPYHVQTTWDEQLAMEIADEFEGAEMSLDDPEAVEAYGALAVETMDQYFALVDAGYKFDVAPQGEDYTVDSLATIATIRKDKKLPVQLTQFDFGAPGEFEAAKASGHPLLAPAIGRNGKPIKVKKRVGGKDVTYELVVNDIFRFVHDMFGHATYRNQFGPLGEENAWRAHARMFTPKARRAMTAETRYQNSWVNAGRHLRREDGTLPKRGDADFVERKDRPFGEQKVFLPPEERAVPAMAGDQEASWFVPGMDVDTARRLGLEFEQKQVAHSDGMLNTDGSPDVPATGQYSFGDEAVTDAGYTELYLPDGRKVPFRQEYSDRDVSASPPKPPPTTEVVVELGDGQSHLPWGATDMIWQAAMDTKPHRASAYVSGRKWAPPGTRPVHELNFEGLGGTSTVRSARDWGLEAAHQVDVWVPHEDAVLMDRSTSRTPLHDDRTSADRIGRWQIRDQKRQDSQPVGQGYKPGRNPLRQHGAGVALVNPIAGDIAILEDATPPTYGGLPNGYVRVEFDDRGRIGNVNAPTAALYHDALKSLSEELGVNVERAKYVSDSEGDSWHFRFGATATGLGYGPPGQLHRHEKTAPGYYSEWEDDWSALGLGKLHTPGDRYPIDGMVGFGQVISEYAVLFGKRDPATTTPWGSVPSEHVRRFVDEFGPLADAVNEVYRGVTITTLPGNEMAHADYDANRIRLDGRVLLASQVAPAQAANWAGDTNGFHPRAAAGVDVASKILVHELGHMVHKQAQNRSADAIARAEGAAFGKRLNRFEKRSLVSQYALENDHEFFAEAFSRAVYDPSAPPSLKAFVRNVVELARTPNGETFPTMHGVDGSYNPAEWKGLLGEMGVGEVTWADWVEYEYWEANMDDLDVDMTLSAETQEKIERMKAEGKTPPGKNPYE